MAEYGHHNVLAAKLQLPPERLTDRALWHLELGYQPGDEYVGDDGPLAYCIFPALALARDTTRPRISLSASSVMSAHRCCWGNSRSS